MCVAKLVIFCKESLNLWMLNCRYPECFVIYVLIHFLSGLSSAKMN